MTRIGPISTDKIRFNPRHPGSITFFDKKINYGLFRI